MVIVFTRGDTQIIKFGLKDKAGNDITLAEGDKLYFTVKKTTTSKDVLFQKVYPTNIVIEDGLYKLTIEPTDTDELEYGEYNYDIELKTGTYVKTLIKDKLIITDEVTFAGDEV